MSQRIKFGPLLLAFAALLLGRADSSAAPAGMAKRLIDQLHLQPIPDEGGWYAVTYGSEDQIPGASLPLRYGGKSHSAGSCIYFVETREDFSAMHRLQTDETWHFYGGAPIEMLLLYPDGHGETVIIGPDVFAGQHPQFTVPRGVWQGSAPKAEEPEAYSFAGDQLSPAFDYADFEIGYRDELQKAYPAQAEQVARLTREKFAVGSTQKQIVTSPASLQSAIVLPPDLPKSVEVAPGMILNELVGRSGPAFSNSHSVARFTLESGHSTLTSHNKVSEETFLIISGHGQLTLEGKSSGVGPGSVVSMHAGVNHSLRAGADGSLEFYAIESPAFAPDDMVAEPASK